MCPGKRKRCTTNQDVVSESDLSFDVKSPRTLDSTFEIESSDEESNSLPEPCEEVLSNPITLPDEPLHDNSYSFSDCEESVTSASSESSGEEIWDVSDEEAKNESEVRKL